MHALALPVAYFVTGALFAWAILFALAVAQRTREFLREDRMRAHMRERIAKERRSV